MWPDADGRRSGQPVRGWAIARGSQVEGAVSRGDVRLSPATNTMVVVGPLAGIIPLDAQVFAVIE